MTYGQVLDKLLQEKDVSRAELARRIGKSRSYVSQLIGMERTTRNSAI